MKKHVCTLSREQVEANIFAVSPEVSMWQPNDVAVWAKRHGVNDDQAAVIVQHKLNGNH